MAAWLSGGNEAQQEMVLRIEMGGDRRKGPLRSDSPLKIEPGCDFRLGIRQA